MANKIIHKHSSVITENGKAKLPSAEQLEYGEIAVNYADGVETISFKNSSNNIVEFKSANHFEKIIREDEVVTAAALTDLDARLSVIETGEPIIDIIAAETAEMKGDIQDLSGQVTAIASDIEDSELVIATALTDLNDRVLAIENEPEIVITSSTIKDTVQNASGITANASGVVQAKAVYEYAPSKTEVEDMEYVLTLSVTDLDSRVKTLNDVIANSKIPGTAFKITNKLNDYLIGGPTYSMSNAGELLHTYNFNSSNLSSCMILPVFDEEEINNGIQHPKTISAIYSGEYNGFGMYYNMGLKYGSFTLKVNNLTYNTCDIIGYGGNKGYTSSTPLPVYFIAIDTNGQYDIDTFYIQSGGHCFVKNTLITLSDNTTKLVQDINYNDELLVWNFDDGKYDSAKPCWIKKEEKTTYYYKVSLDNGTIINLVGSNGKCHRLFSVEDGMFISATDMVGKTTYTQNGESKVISCELIQEECVYYNIITEKHINLFANAILTSCRYNNIYPIEDMKFVKDDRINRAPKWKLYEQFRDYAVLGRYIEDLRLYEQLDIPLDETIKYCENLERLRKKLDDFTENKEIITSIEDTEVGWIDEEGNAYGFRTYMPGQYNHIILADKICDLLKISTNNTSRELEKMGWVKYTTDFVLNSNDKMINKKQLNALRTFLNVPNKLKTEGKIRIGSIFSEHTDVKEFDTMDEYSFEYRKKLPINKIF